MIDEQLEIYVILRVKLIKFYFWAEQGHILILFKTLHFFSSHHWMRLLHSLTDLRHSASHSWVFVASINDDL